MSKEMTAKEALKWLFLKASKQHYQLWAIKLTKPYGERKKLVDEITSDLDNHGGELNDTFDSIYNALTELEELKQCDTPMKWIDVVDETGHYDKCPVCGYPSYNDLGHNHFCTVCGQRLEFEEVGNEE